jgi:hypothetical protein
VGDRAINEAGKVDFLAREVHPASLASSNTDRRRCRCNANNITQKPVRSKKKFEDEGFQ